MSEMNALDIARRLAQLGQSEEACQAYTLFLRLSDGSDPDAEMEASLYILQFGGDYKAAYDGFLSLYNRDCYRPDCLNIMTEAFYLPNEKEIKNRYERNCRWLEKYPYLFRKDFPAFEDLPIRFFPYDENGYLPFDTETGQFGEYIDFNYPVVSRNFFRDLEKPVLAENVYSQYELDYLHDNVRPSEYIGRENHLYLHYTDWMAFCAHLQVLNVKRLLNDEKLVFLIGDEIAQYPIDFKERFGIDYSVYPVKSIGIREVNRIIWHAQLSTHNGGDFFNEIFDNHPNLIYMSSVWLWETEETAQDILKVMDELTDIRDVHATFEHWNNPRLVDELYYLKNRDIKDVMVAMFLALGWSPNLDMSSRIAPALFFQPHFGNIVYEVAPRKEGGIMLTSKQADQIRSSPIFKAFKYLKSFFPMRRITTSYAATVRFMVHMSDEEEREEGKRTGIVGDTVSVHLLNRSFMADRHNHLYKDSVLVRFEDAKLNPTATFKALAAFVDLPYTQTMTECTFAGMTAADGGIGMSTAAVYRTYDEYAGVPERYFLEYFLRDAYQNYGYDFQYYDGAPVDEQRVRELVDDFSVIREWNRRVYRQVFHDALYQGRPEEDLTEADRSLLDEETEIKLQAIKDICTLNARILLRELDFVNKEGEPLRMIPRLELDPDLLEQPLYR